MKKLNTKRSYINDVGITLQFIKQIILDTAKRLNIQVDKIILFGSRARGDYREDSDWDILIVTNEKLDRRKYLEFYSSVIKALYEEKVKSDLIIMDKETFEEEKHILDTIPNEAFTEGITLWQIRL